MNDEVNFDVQHSKFSIRYLLPYKLFLAINLVMLQPNSPDTAEIDDKHKLLGLDHLRAFAILYVLLFHYKFFGHPAWEVPIGVFGWTGVDLFLF